jgi:hypothetical protein
MTEEDFINNLEFRAYIKSLKNTFPFVVGYRFPENFEEKLQSYSSIVPIHLVVSLSKILEQYPNWKPMWYVPSYIDKDGYYDGIYFSSAFETDENKEQSKVEDSMGKVFDRVRKSTVIPRNKKLHKTVVPTIFKFVS